jgi:hypothetical protein
MNEKEIKREIERNTIGFPDAFLKSIVPEVSEERLANREEAMAKYLEDLAYGEAVMTWNK